MINKQNLWFITLFSLIMVLSIYYLTMGEDTFASLNVNNNEAEKTDVVISESDTLVALKVADEEALVTKMEELQDILLSSTATIEEKNKAYDELQNINKNEASKEAIIKKIKDEFKLDSYVSIEGNNIKVTIASEKHDTALANRIIRSIQSLYQEDKYITIKFDN